MTDTSVPEVSPPSLQSVPYPPGIGGSLGVQYPELGTLPVAVFVFFLMTMRD